MKRSVTTLQKQKIDKNPISILTAYDYTTATLIESAGIDAVLVGDSLGMTMLGLPDTLAVTMEDMIHHTRAVSRGLHDTFLIADMPFMSYQVSIEEAVHNAGRLVKEGFAQAVKLEGGAKVAHQIKAIVNADIPVCAHIGLTPQSINAFGGFKVQGKNEEAAKKLIEDAKIVQEAGAFMLVLECVPAKLAQIITNTVDIPTIGIGAGNGCDGQVLVYQDMLAMFSNLKPKFVKHYAKIGEEIVAAFRAYDAEVKAKTFPTDEHTFVISDEIIKKLY